MRRKVLISSNDIDWKPYEPYEPKKREPKVELQKVDTAKFVFAWENSSSVEEVVRRMKYPRYKGAMPEDDIASTRKVAEVIRTVEQLPLRELPDHAPKAKSGKINNLTIPKE